MIKVKNDSTYDKSVYIINPSNITHINAYCAEPDCCIPKRTYVLSIFFVDQKCLELATYNEDKFNAWLKLFERHIGR